MGVMHHHAVIATTWDLDAHAEVVRWTSDRQGVYLVSGPTMNNYSSVVLAPDGSKEGWDESDAGDAERKAFIDKLSECSYSTGASKWDWVEVGFGEAGADVIGTNCEDVLG